MIRLKTVIKYSAFSCIPLVCQSHMDAFHNDCFVTLLISWPICICGLGLSCLLTPELGKDIQCHV